MDAGLLTIGARVEFAHPLVRSATYRTAAAAERHRVHQALAEATDGETDPDRRAWHHARATAGPDAEVAAELERSASRAQARGGLAAAAAFLQRAVELTPDPAERAVRALAAAQAKSAAGDIEAAEALLAVADAGPLDDLAEARAQRLRAELAFDLTRGRDAPPCSCAPRSGSRSSTRRLRARRISKRSWPRCTRAGIRPAATPATSPVRHSPLRSPRTRRRPRSSCW